MTGADMLNDATIEPSRAPAPPSIDAEQIHKFLTILHRHVAALAALLPQGVDPGVMQLIRMTPSDQTVVASRYLIGDVDGMACDAVAAAQAGHNVYVEGRTVRHDLRGNCRGDIADTVFVFALVVDNDGDTGKAVSRHARSDNHRRDLPWQFA
jgi:hypothetical protein